MCGLALILAAIVVRTDFEAGSAGEARLLAENHLRVAVKGETDQDGRNRQPSWFYFRLDGVAGRDLLIELAELWGEYNYRRHDGSGHRNMRPVYSYDNENWQHFESSEWDAATSSIRVRIKPVRDRLWVARQPPYTTARLRRLLARLRGPFCRQELVGHSVEGRPIVLLTITDPRVADRDKKVIWLMARQHAWESGTSWVMEGALRFLVSADREAARARRECLFKIFPMADPDGVYRGGVRFNKYGYDLNRNWDAVDPARMPEIYCQRRAILGWLDRGGRVDLFLTLHNTESQDYIEGPLEAGGPAIRELGWRFWRLLVERTSFHSPGGPRSQAETTSPGVKGRMTVNQALFWERKVPAFLMELMVDPHPRLGRPPTVKDRLEFGAALITVLRMTVQPEPRAKIEN